MVPRCIYLPILFAFLKPATGLTCLQCTNVPEPRLCSSVTECFHGEVCGVEKKFSEFGWEMFNVGCMKESKCNATLDLQHCIHCCNSTLCNSEGCGKQGYSDNHGPVCFNCPVYSEKIPCRNIDVCSIGEKCFLEGKRGFGEVIYSSKCLDDHACKEGNIISNVLVGRDTAVINDEFMPEKRSVFEEVCRSCCDDNLCNIGCNISHIVTTPASKCQYNPCLHGHCYEVAEHFVCVCEHGYEGAICNISTASPSRCNPNLCNHGQCYDAKDDYVCVCDHGYEGRMCNISTYACSSNPCVHGRCFNEDGGYRCLCNTNFGGTHCDKPEGSDCFDILKLNIGQESGIYSVDLWKSHRKIEVYCDMETDGGGWTVFQSRFNGSVDFYRNFSQYDQGFGSLHGEFWLGLSYIQEMVSQNQTELRLDLTAEGGNVAYEVFQNLRLGNNPEYTISFATGSGTAGDSGLGLSYNNGYPFSTFDHDHTGSHNCPKQDRGGWWYQTCTLVNLNGEYVQPGTQNGRNAEAGIIYREFQQMNSLKATNMKFRRRL